MNERILELAKQAGMEPDELDENEGTTWITFVWNRWIV